MVAEPVPTGNMLDPMDRLAHNSGFIWKRAVDQRAGFWAECPFPGEITYGQIGQISVCRLTANPHRVERRIGTTRGSDQNFIKIVVQLKGEADLEQIGKSVHLSPGEWSLYDPARPYSVSNYGPVEQLIMLLPRNSICVHHADVSRLTLAPYGIFSGVQRMVTGFIISLGHEFDSISLARQSEISDTAIQLLRLAVTERQTEHRLYSMRDVLRERIKSYVGAHLHDPDLSIDQIAAALNCTARNLHKVFADQEQTIGQYIYELRLSHCYADLQNRNLRKKTVTEIAFSWGFNNASHFSRAFKARFGTTPKTCRG